MADLDMSVLVSHFWGGHLSQDINVLNAIPSNQNWDNS